MLLKTILSDFTQPVCPKRVFEEFIFPKINWLMNKGSEEDKMKFVIELLVSKIGDNVDKDQPTVNVETLLFLAGVYKIVGENTITTGITMEGLARLTSR